MTKTFAAAAAVAASLLSFQAYAGCQIHNDTGESFTIESGNTSNQRVGGHTTTSIAAGKIIAKGDKGQNVGGSCKDGEKVKIVEEKGAFILLPGN